jgi:4-amino-4-deoxy-L-arabinose transferase-like glycosyltransferase
MSQQNIQGPQSAPDLILANPIKFTVVLCLLWILPGLVGHDPWKPDEAYSFGLVYHILQTGDWIVPTLAQEPFMEKPPIFYITAAILAKTFGGLLPLHDAARLASGLYMALTFLLVTLTGRELYGSRGWLATLVLLGTVGLVERAHALITDVSQLTGFALAIYGLTLTLRRPLLGGLWLGTGVGLAFMSKGLLGPGCMALTAVLLPLVSSKWRTRSYAAALGVAVVACLPWLTIWPWLLWLRSPELFQEWFWVNNVGRFLGDNALGPSAKPWYYLAVLPWYALPSLPLALWALWQGRREISQDPGLHLPLVAMVVILVVLSASRQARELYAMPMLIPLALLAVPGLFALRRGGTNAFWWFSALFFAVAALVGWFYWVGLDLGVPAQLHRHLIRMRPAYVPNFDLFRFAVALAYTAFFAWVLIRLTRTPERPLVAWAAGVTMVWGLLAAFFLAYVDSANSYRSVVQHVARSLPPDTQCISARNVGEPQRALFHYMAGIITYRDDVPTRKRDCNVLLVQGFRSHIYQPDQSWILLWEGARPGDNKELFRLYRRR